MLAGTQAVFRWLHPAHFAGQQLREPGMTRQSATKIEIKRPSPVGWFSLKLLVRTGIKVLVSSLVGTQTGRREILAALDVGKHAGEPYDYSKFTSERGDSDVWIDYVADLGDGFDATHSIAWLVGRDFVFLDAAGNIVSQPVPPGPNEEVSVACGPGVAHPLPRADLLLFGGDQVYPYATQQDYLDRTFGPYYAARPWGSPDPLASDDKGSRPVFAIPGNHDWYDGLNGFIRMFCQPGRWMGCWEVQQRRSYFALRLPQGFWIWGVDLATEDDIDPPQLNYFQSQAKLLGGADQVVICSPKPAWVDCAVQTRHSADIAGFQFPETWRKLEFVIDIATKAGATVPLCIAGDLHNYAHYRTASGQQHYITCGGGGAFALGTTVQPDSVALGARGIAHREHAFPSVSESRSMRKGALLIARRHSMFCAVFATVMLWLVWLFQSSSLLLLALGGSGRHWIHAPFLETMRTAVTSPSTMPSAFSDLLTIALNRPGTTSACLFIWMGFCAFASSGARRDAGLWQSVVLGTFHFACQFFVAILIVLFVVELFENFGGDGGVLWLFRTITVPMLSVAIGFVCNGSLFGLYLWCANQFAGAHEQEIYSSQAIQDWKCFLRMKVGVDGLTIFPVGLRKVECKWQRALGPRQVSKRSLARLKYAISTYLAGDLFDVPKGTTRLYNPSVELAPELIESPIKIPRRH
ncbi:metallophosphoesterase [Mesorhizobium sp. M0340]|uniref:metallophosphoesterase n=1 Tax=Mesorhizobium sp. M0340 TaxID=2956939 RepID=UPI00333DDC21